MVDVCPWRSILKRVPNTGVESAAQCRLMYQAINAAVAAGEAMLLVPFIVMRLWCGKEGRSTRLFPEVAAEEAEALGYLLFSEQLDDPSALTIYHQLILNQLFFGDCKLRKIIPGFDAAASAAHELDDRAAELHLVRQHINLLLLMGRPKDAITLGKKHLAAARRLPKSEDGAICMLLESSVAFAYSLNGDRARANSLFRKAASRNGNTLPVLAGAMECQHLLFYRNSDDNNVQTIISQSDGRKPIGSFNEWFDKLNVLLAKCCEAGGPTASLISSARRLRRALSPTKAGRRTDWTPIFLYQLAVSGLMGADRDDVLQEARELAKKRGIKLFSPVMTERVRK